MDLVGAKGFVVEEFSPFTSIGTVLRNFGMPLGLWGIALLLAVHANLPDYLSGLKIHGPYLILTGGLSLSLAFRRGRAFFVLSSLSLAYIAFVFFLEQGNAGFIARTVYAAVCVFVPLNIAVFTLLRERGVWNAPGLRRMSLPLIEVGAIVAIVLSDAAEFTEMLYLPILEQVVLSPRIHIPQVGIVCAVAAVSVAVVCAVVRGSVIDAAFAAAAACFALACNDLPFHGPFAWFCTMAGMIVAIAVVQDSHRMAFYDELTGLPGRRALNERLGALDGTFTVAMIDIDHFKAFNDTWGHDVGDQVLKLVASRLRRVGGGGMAYRYGGEEFTIIFAARRANSVMHHFEDLRKDIENYKVTLRDRSPPKDAARGTPGPSVAGDNKGTSQWISVTVSIGVGERTDRAQLPERALEAADQAVYRAKAQGRNRVSR